MGAAGRSRPNDYYSQMAQRQRSFAVPSLSEQRARPGFNYLDGTTPRGLSYDRSGTYPGFNFGPSQPIQSKPVNDTFEGIVDDLGDKPVNDTFTGIVDDTVSKSPFASDSRYGDFGIVERDGAFDFYSPTADKYVSRFGSLEDAEAGLQKELDKKARGERSYLDSYGTDTDTATVTGTLGTSAVKKDFQPFATKLDNYRGVGSGPAPTKVEITSPSDDLEKISFGGSAPMFRRRAARKPGMDFSDALRERKATGGRGLSIQERANKNYQNKLDAYRGRMGSGASARGRGFSAPTRSGRSDGRGMRFGSRGTTRSRRPSGKTGRFG